MTELRAPRRAMRAPRRSLKQWAGVFHMLARFYMNYEKAILKAARRKRRRGVDIDFQESKEGTLWGLHWPTVGRNKLHDSHGKINKNRRIDSLTDAEIDRLRGPDGAKPHSLAYLLERAADRHVRVEAEAKITPSEEKVRNLLARPKIAEMDARGDLQFKTLAFITAPHGPANRLRPIHDAGGTTILTFTGFGRRRGLSERETWPVTDYVRGRARWTA
jgi:hypothetical protein